MYLIPSIYNIIVEDNNKNESCRFNTTCPGTVGPAKDFLERLVGRSVDVIRDHKNLNPRLRSRIERDGVTVF